MCSPGTQINGEVTGKGICTNGCRSSAVKQQVGMKGAEINELWLKRKNISRETKRFKLEGRVLLPEEPPLSPWAVNIG